MVRSFGKGWAAALQMPGVILLKYILNVIGAAGVAVPIFFTFRDFFGDSAVTEDMFATMPIGGLAEFLFAEEGALVRSFLATVPLIIVFLLVNLFITGGILQRIALGRRMPWAEFFASSARLFPVLLVIELMNAVLFAAVVVLPYIGLSKAHEWIIDGAITPTPGMLFTWLWWFLIAVLFIVAGVVHDYTRVRLVSEPRRNPFSTWALGLAFAVVRLPKTATLWLALILIPWLITLVVNPLSKLLLEDNVGALAAVFAIAQALVIVRIGGGLARLAAQFEYANTDSPSNDLASEPPPDTVLDHVPTGSQP